MPDPRHALGHLAEATVARWLTGFGWRLLARRWRGVSGGELDLVCLTPNGMLVGIEVRARRSDRSGSAAESVDRRKVGRLRAALSAYAIAEPVPHRGLRIDLVTVSPGGGQAAGRWLLQRLPGVDAW